jgi:hypothetical protein
MFQVPKDDEQRDDIWSILERASEAETRPSQANLHEASYHADPRIEKTFL